jgi:uncharacterized membrane protein
MTKKDYIAVARILAQYNGKMPPEQFEHLLHDFADYFAADNVRFDRARFVDFVAKLKG